MAIKRSSRGFESKKLSAKPTLYKQVQDDLRCQILKGTFGPGDRLLSERELSRHYEVSKITIRRAIAELSQEGLLCPVQGKGVFVTARSQDKASQETVRFVIVTPQANRDITEQVLKMFAEQEPGYRVEMVMPTLNQDTREVMKEGLADVCVVREDELPGLTAEGSLLDLTEFAERDLDMESYYPEPFLFGSKGSRIYAFPVTFSPVVMAYNRAHFQEAGLDYPDDWDWATFLDYAQRLTVRVRRDGEVARCGFFIRRHPNRWTTFLLQNNGGVFDANGNFILDSAPSLEALRFCRDLVVKHRVASIAAPLEPTRPFVTGMTSMCLESYYFVHLNKVDFEWDLGRLPRGRTQATLYVGTHIGIQRECRHPELAWELIKFFVSPVAQHLFLEKRIGGPVLRSVAEEDAQAWPRKHRDLFWKEMAVARPIYWGNDSTSMKELVSDGLEMVWLGLETVEEACAEIRRRAGLAGGLA